jgi:hypothetical protein
MKSKNSWVETHRGEYKDRELTNIIPRFMYWSVVFSLTSAMTQKDVLSKENNLSDYHKRCKDLYVKALVPFEGNDFSYSTDSIKALFLFV